MPPLKKITIKAPATIANLVCGFDILGMAINAPFDVMHLTLLDEERIVLKNTGIYPLPESVADNVAGAALTALIKAYELRPELKKPYPHIGFELVTDKKIKPGSGLGSSAASSAGAVVAANLLLDDLFSKEELVTFAMYGEKVASGVKHADNVAPCIYGGVTLVRSAHPLDIIPLPAPPLHITVVHPQIEVRTSDARQILRKEVLLKTAIKQWGNIAGLVAGLFRNDYNLIGNSLSDEIIEPTRSILIPGFQKIKDAGKAIGCLGGGISGSGPSIFMLSKEEQTAQDIAGYMGDVYDKLGIDFHCYVTALNTQGITASTF
ncbi:homoserine kinase [Taibaiella chishuiensis]|uniref:Homoserine kinase n=1 Tax=Taibaiella chishuiensis TaxID=1434707 RepID=A0A2P8D5N7_9BACT|nr:homoserine kinase [Taibaiella chishuiensis]PSK92530.1 homoserine kinase [Taibaiella chishuiensis]